MSYVRKHPYLIAEPVRDRYSLHVVGEDETYCFSQNAANLLLQLNGRKHPYSINKNCSKRVVDAWLDEFRNKGLLLSEKRTKITGIGSMNCAMIYFENRKIYRIIGAILNYLLLAFFIPILIMGVITFLKEPYVTYHLHYGEIIEGFIYGTIIGTVFHVISCIAACQAFKARVYEVGIGIKHFVPYAYVNTDVSRVAGRLKRAQISFAGIEMHLLLCGTLLNLLPFSKGHFNPALLISAAFANLVYALINIALVKTIDRKHVFADLWGINEDLTTMICPIPSGQKGAGIFLSTAFAFIPLNILACKLIGIRGRLPEGLTGIFIYIAALLLMLCIEELIICSVCQIINGRKRRFKQDGF